MQYDLDLHKHDIFANPYPLYHRLQSAHPVHLDSYLGCWVVTSYVDIVAALANRNLSSMRTIRVTRSQEKEWRAVEPLFTTLSNLMFFADPPKHTRLRSLINSAFSSRMIERWRDQIAQFVNSQLDAVQDQETMDIIRDLAQPLPMRIIANMLGVPVQDQAQFKRWSDDLADFLGNAPTLELCTRLLRSIQDFTQYFREVVKQHVANPQDNLVSALIQAKEKEDLLSEDELLINCVGLFSGGHETTTNLIGNGILALLRNRDEMQRLQNNPTLITSAVEEFLRYDSPVQFTGRIVKQNTTIGKQKVYQGQRVMLMLGAANRDPSQFPDPDRLDIGRQPNRHLAFGNNIHYCVGAALARLEAQIAIEIVLRRLPHIQLRPTPLQWQENLSFHGVKELHVMF